MAEPKLVIESREELWFLLAEASQLEHMIMCQYLYAGFSLKQGTDEGLTEAQAAMVGRWNAVVTDIAVQEMLHLALVANLMSAIGAAPTFTRPNFPQRSGYFPPTIQFDLLPFGDAALTHFLYLERPEGMERLDADGFTPTAPQPLPLDPDELFPREQEFSTVGHLYRGIAAGFQHLVDRYGEHAVFVGPPRAQATPELFRWPDLVAVTDLASALAAIEEIVEQGEGARGDWQDAHYGRFLRVWTELGEARRSDPGFEPARPVVPAFLRQPYDSSIPRALVTDPAARAVAELFDLGYEVLLQVLTRFFTHTDETDEELRTLVGVAVGVMAGVLRPLGTALTRLPVGADRPGRTAGPAFEMYYQMGNFVPWREAAWALLRERLDVLAERCRRLDGTAGLPAVVPSAGERATALAARLARRDS